jgi:hypothetical protein
VEFLETTIEEKETALVGEKRRANDLDKELKELQSSFDKEKTALSDHAEIPVK